MMGSERGSTLIWWVIVLFVLFVIASVLAYVQFTDKAELADRIADLEGQINGLEGKNGELVAKNLAFSGAIGFRESELAESNLDAMREKIARLRGKVNTVSETDTSLEKVVRALESAYDDAVRAKNDATSKYEEARKAEQAAMDQADAQGEEKDKEIADLRAQLSAQQERATRNQGKSQVTIDTQRETITRLQEEQASRAEQWKREKNELENRLLAMDARMQEINERNRIIRSKDGPDGRVIDADDPLGLVYIDIGARQGLKRGTRFQVWSYGKGKVRVPKGWIQVRDVRGEYAVAGVTEVEDAYNPIGAGDYVSNVLYDRDKAPEFVFLGNLPGRYDNEEAARLLRERGARVAEHVSANTDFLVMGEKPAGEGEEDLVEQPAYKLAVQYGVEILPASELVQYIRY